MGLQARTQVHFMLCSVHYKEAIIHDLKYGRLSVGHLYPRCWEAQAISIMSLTHDFSVRRLWATSKGEHFFLTARSQTWYSVMLRVISLDLNPNRLNTFDFRLIQGGKKRRKAISEQVVLSCLSYFCRRLYMAFHIPSCKGGCCVIIDSSSF